jgi:hypothetical protein
VQALALLALGTIAAINYAHKLEYTPSSGFRTHARPSHDGIDYHASKGTPVVLAQGGKVVQEQTQVVAMSHDAERSTSEILIAAVAGVIMYKLRFA